MNHISAENVARRYAVRPGCRFVGYREVAIAVFLMDVRVVLLKRRLVPPIDEYLLRGLDLQICEPPALSELLGLDPRTVHNRLVELRRSELIDVSGTGDSSAVRCSLTHKGREVSQALQQTVYAEEVIKIAYHGFLRRPIIVSPEALLRPQEAKSKDLLTVRAIPSRYPRPDEIDLTEMSEVIKRQWKRRDKGKPPELISVRSVLSGVKTMYLPAVMLQYEQQAAIRRQRHVAFAVDGVVNEEYERAFSACGGLDKHPDLLLPAFRTTKQLVAEYMPPHIAQKLGNLDDVDELVEKLDVVSETLDSHVKQSQSEDRVDTRQVLREQLERERQEKALLEKQLSERKAHRVRTYECAKLLTKTLDSAQERLIILSAFLSEDAVDSHFLRRLEAALKRGVKVWIGYGMGQHGERQQAREKSRDWEKAEAALLSVQAKYKDTFQLRDFGDTHEKILLCDQSFVVSGSYNWLSFKANPKSKKKRQEDAILAKDPEIIEEYFAELTGRFAAGQPNSAKAGPADQTP